ncbi:uncharacterized protein DUF2155 [Pacificibacter maritimus]|uniref:Uncharacterized protein DUF2155 n=1 Tax=Pacificibacter maritimus TaxID=762213 RepID=A0A3N4UN22_9RHOB|nr:DUF2155 domain-containing protein [Pacificibacter maritimus]RPE71843.1 uncharacterized protein DUF2155 [Pacificibacter maritimus]
MKLGPFICAAILFGTLSAAAQDNGLGDDFQTGIDDILVEPLDESGIGFGGDGLSLEDLQNFPGSGFQQELKDITTETQVPVSSASGANLRALDKLTGEVQDLTVVSGQPVVFGRISVLLGDCRYPKDNRSGDAFAYLIVHAQGIEDPVFSGWMVASSPALNAMDHARYDIWPLTCNIS